MPYQCSQFGERIYKAIMNAKQTEKRGQIHLIQRGNNPQTFFFLMRTKIFMWIGGRSIPQQRVYCTRLCPGDYPLRMYSRSNRNRSIDEISSGKTESLFLLTPLISLITAGCGDKIGVGQLGSREVVGSNPTTPTIN